MAKMRLSQVAESRRVATLGACVATCVATAATEQRPRQLPRCPCPCLLSPVAVCLSLFPPGTLARYLCNGTHFSSVLARSPLTLPLSLLLLLSLPLCGLLSLFPSLLSCNLSAHFSWQHIFLAICISSFSSYPLFATLGACHITTMPAAAAATEVATATYATAAAFAMQRCMTH